MAGLRCAWLAAQSRVEGRIWISLQNTTRSFRPHQAARSRRHASQTHAMASQDLSTVCVHAATPAELAAARERLQQAGPLSLGKDGDGTALAAALLFPDASPPAEGGASPAAAACGAFSPSQYYASLAAAGGSSQDALGRVLLTAGATPSTQTLVQDNIARLPDGLVFVADRQAGGKGRAGNSWVSPEGCLMFSACKRLEVAGQRLPFVQYLVSLAVVQAVQAEAAARLQGGAPLDVRIKWPNDLYAGGLKLGGILCHSAYRDSVFHVTMGVGLNLSNREPTTCVDALIAAAAAAAGAAEAPPPVPREALLAGVLGRLGPMLERLAVEGFAPFEGGYYGAWLHSGQAVEVEEEGEGQGGEGERRRVGVVIQGLSPHGYLLAVDGGGQRYELHPDGNSLDFFAGLVRKKVPAA